MKVFDIHFDPDKNVWKLNYKGKCLAYLNKYADAELLAQRLQQRMA